MEVEDALGYKIINQFDVDDVVRALRRIEISPKARVMLLALASAPNRAMSRYDLAIAAGVASKNSANSALGHFAKALILELDPQLDAIKAEGGDYVMALFHAAARLAEPLEGESDWWVFVMAERLAQALDRLGWAAYTSISDQAFSMWVGDDDEDEEDDAEGDADDRWSGNPLDEVAIVEESGELDELDDTEREAVIMARVGQGRFRDALLERWDSCCAVTNVPVVEALVASHIKPWSVADNIERLDPSNGLLLVGTLDRLFDEGLITFDDTGRIRISPRIPATAYEGLGLSLDMNLRDITPDMLPYLAFHAEYCFWDTLSDDDE